MMVLSFIHWLSFLFLRLWWHQLFKLKVEFFSVISWRKFRLCTTVKCRKKIVFNVVCNAGIFFKGGDWHVPDLTKMLMLGYFLDTVTLLKQDLSSLINYNPIWALPIHTSFDDLQNFKVTVMLESNSCSISVLIWSSINFIYLLNTWLKSWMLAFCVFNRCDC